MHDAVLLCTMADGAIVRLPPELAAKVDAVAHDEQRSRSNAASRLITEALASRDVESTNDGGSTHGTG
jgi:metal-responsive CopG/Arc/MetJ family transcriptional regulator